MEFIFLVEKIDTSKEHEIFSENEFGFVVRIVYTLEYSNELRYKEKLSYNLNNITEIHLLYDYHGFEKEKKIAFESDIHSSGCTRRVEHIESINVCLDTKKHNYYYNGNT